MLASATMSFRPYRRGGGRAAHSLVQDIGHKIQHAGYRIQDDTGCKIHDKGYRMIQDTRYTIQDTGCGIQDKG